MDLPATILKGGAPCKLCGATGTGVKYAGAATIKPVHGPTSPLKQ